MAHYLRTVYSTMKYRFIEFYRVFNLTSFALRFSTPLMTIFIAWILLNNVFGSTIPSFSAYAFSGNYLGFIVLGTAIYTYVYGTVFIVGRTYFWDQMMGTIEPRLMTPSSRSAYMVGTVMFGMLNATIDCVVVIGLGWLLIGAPLNLFHPEFLVIGLLLLVTSMFGVGLVVNGITCTFRDRTNTANILSSVFFVFCGIIAPVGMLPEWGQVIGNAIPLTYALQLIRLSTAPSVDMNLVLQNGMILIGFSIALTLVGVIFLRLFEKNLKTRANLTVF